jgi:hypothetical protein
VARGFDAVAIQNKSRPEDRRQHAVLGEVFRVAILRNGWRGNKTACKTDKLAATTALPSSGSSSGGSGLTPTLSSGAVPPQLAIGDKSASEDSDSSSSSSSRHKKSKKSKKSKKGKKAKKEERKRKRDGAKGAAADPGEFKCLFEVTFAEVILLDHH